MKTAQADQDAGCQERTVEFDVASIRKQVSCMLCEGLFREPYTTLKCYHTFCKSCLSAALFSSGDNICPQCDLYLGRQLELSKLALPDRTLEALIDHVFFPAVAKADRALEADFYKKRGIARKVGVSSSNKARTVESDESSTDTITFRLVPDVSRSNVAGREPLRGLKFPIIETNGNIRIGQLKLFLLKKLFPPTKRQDTASSAVPDQSNTVDEPHGEEIEILCNSITLGNELSVKFVVRTVWMDPTKDLTLTYR